MKDAKQGITRKTVRMYLDEIRSWFIGTDEPEENEQAISMPDVYMAVGTALGEGNQTPDQPYRRLVDCYLNGADVYAIYAMDGQIYKVPVTIVPGGVTLGAAELVEISHNPIVAQAFRIAQQPDGHYRWFAFPAATAVLNRSGGLDTRALFQNFEERINEGEAPFPFLSFYHLGEIVNLGQADWVAAEGYEYLVSGIFNETPLAQAVRKAIEKEPDYWGISIGYYYAPESRQNITVSEGITIPTYTSGVNHEVSILAEKDAACLYTGVTVKQEGVITMNQKAKDALKKIAGEDPAIMEIVDGLETKVDAINADVVANPNLIKREDTTTEPPPQADTTEAAPVAIETEAPAPVVGSETGGAPAAEPIEYNLTEEALQAITSKAVAVMDESLTTMRTAMDGIAAHFDQVTQSIQAVEARIASLEKPIEQQVEQAISDMPRAGVLVGYRPRTAEQPTNPVKMTPSEIAAQALASIPRSNKRSK